MLCKVEELYSVGAFSLLILMHNDFTQRFYFSYMWLLAVPAKAKITGTIIHT